MKLFEIFDQWETVYEDEDGEIFTEGAVRSFKKDKKTNKLIKKFRCTSGPKAGKIAASPAACSKRPDPKKRRQGRKTMRQKKAVIQRKSKVSKKRSISKMLTRMNARAMGKGGTTTNSNNK